MLSIAAMRSGQEGYYQSLAKEDYYVSGGEPPGKWLGDGAKALGLAGVVQAHELSACFRGVSTCGAPLVQNARKENRQPGWDFTFSAPKSVSVLWSQLESNERHEVQAAQAAAVDAAIKYIEKNLLYSRIGRGGTDRVQAGIVAAAFEHSCSRALDPQLHTHCLVMNLGVDAEGAVRSILSKPLYEAKMLVGAYYRCELARQLQERLGLEIERPLNRDGKPQSWFEIKGIQKSILSHFSKRRAAIEAKLGSRGMESASAAAFAALATRKAKTIVPPRNTLHSDWRREGIEFGFSPHTMLKKPIVVPAAEQRRRYRKALLQAVADITFGENCFSKNELTRRTLEAAQGQCLSAVEVADAVERDLQSDSCFASLGTQNGHTSWTTKDVLALEKEFFGAVDELRKRRFIPLSEELVAHSVRQPRGVGGNCFQLDAEQQAAVRYITQSSESVKVVSGFAGTGKTDMLAAAKEALEKGGYRVIGAALAGVAARTLQEKAGIESATVRMRELQLNPSVQHTLKHHATQFAKAAFGKIASEHSPLVIDSKCVLVVDEAGMIGTRDFALLVKAVVSGGGILVVIGDEKQLPSIERGGCFDWLVKELKGIRLTEIRRQIDVKDRKAVKDIVAAKPQEALGHYAKKGQFFVGRTNVEAESQLITDWVKQGGAIEPSKHRIFAGTRSEVARFNALAQWERVQAGFVDPTERVNHDGQLFMVGDRVRFNVSQRTRGIQKGCGGIVIACKDGFAGKYVAIRVDGEAAGSSTKAVLAINHHARQLVKSACGEKAERLSPRKGIVLVPLQTLNPLAFAYKGLSLDYAMTTHLGQGQTVANSYVALGGRMSDRELSYVQMSRHKEGLFLYSNQTDAGRYLTTLARNSRPLAEVAQVCDVIPEYSILAMRMRMSRVKELATNVSQDNLREIQENQYAG